MRHMLLKDILRVLFSLVVKRSSTIQKVKVSPSFPNHASQFGIFIFIMYVEPKFTGGYSH